MCLLVSVNSKSRESSKHRITKKTSEIKCNETTVNNTHFCCSYDCCVCVYFFFRCVVAVLLAIKYFRLSFFLAFEFFPFRLIYQQFLPKSFQSQPQRFYNTIQYILCKWFSIVMCPVRKKTQHNNNNNVEMAYVYECDMVWCSIFDHNCWEQRHKK